VTKFTFHLNANKRGAYFVYTVSTRVLTYMTALLPSLSAASIYTPI